MCVKPVSISASCTILACCWCGTDFKMSSALNGVNFHEGNRLGNNSDSMSSQLGSISLWLIELILLLLVDVDVFVVVLRFPQRILLLEDELPIDNSCVVELAPSSSSSSIMLIPLSPSESDVT